MGVSFFERMQGHLTTKDGSVLPIDFEVLADSKHLSGIFSGARIEVSGVVRALPWAKGSALSGSLCISPVIHRSIEYDFSFIDDDGELLAFQGRKKLTPLSPVKSLTQMEASLSKAGKTLAQGTMHFDLKDIGPFLKSWSATTLQQSADLGAGSTTETVPSVDLSEALRLKFLAYGRAVICPGGAVPAFDDQTAEAALNIYGRLPSHIRLLYRLALKALDGFSLQQKGRRFMVLSERDRAQLMGEDSVHSSTGRALALLLGMPIKAAHFGRADVISALGLPTYENPVREPEPRYMELLTTPEDLPSKSEIEADVLVIGTGAGGGPVAAALAEAGLAVAVVEAGDYARRPQFSGDAHSRLQHFWRDSGMSFTLGNVPVGLPTGKLVGGSTAINSGTCFRTPPQVFQEWREQLKFPQAFNEDDFSAYFDQVEGELQVGPGAPSVLGDIASVVANGAEKMGMKHGPLPRNAPGCDGQGVCTLGCPSDAKRSTNVSYIPRAMSAGANLFTGFKVRRLLRQGRDVLGAEALGSTASGAPRKLIVKARATVLACGAVHSPVMLLNNGFSNPWIGKNLSIHPALGMFLRLNKEGKPWRAIPQSYGAEASNHPRVRFEGFYMPPQISAAIAPLNGLGLTEWMNDVRRIAQFGFMVRDRGVGQIRRDHKGRPVIFYTLTPELQSIIRSGAATLAELLIRGGAKEVLTMVGDFPPVTTIDQARALGKASLKATDFSLMGFHPLGTCRMAADHRTGVVDFNHRVFGSNNLYVIDGSAVPTSLGVNPQVTIMAMALRAAENLISHLN